MHIRMRRRAVLIVTVLVTLLLAAGAYASDYYEASPAGPITAATGSLRFSGGNLNIECEATLTGSISEGTLEGTTGAPIGQITGVTVPRCNTGSVTATPGLPWSLTYESTLGTLPLITGLGLTLNGLAISFSLPDGRRCEYSGSVPLLLALTGSEPLQTGALSVGAGAQLHRVSGGCHCPPSVTLSGRFSFTEQAIQPNPTWIMAMGDSYISGEGGRWAGNTAVAFASQRMDALGATAYNDNPAGTAELVPRCHRSRSNEVAIGVPGMGGAIAACSGAKTGSFWAPEPLNLPGGPLFLKPGLDFVSNFVNNNISGQLESLRVWLGQHRRGVRMIVVSIGGNDFNFGDIVAQCLRDFINPVPRLCSQRAEVLANFTQANIDAVRERIKNALLNIRQLMLASGYADGSYRILVQNYPSPIPEEGPRFRYPETIVRQTTGGCGIYNADAWWANTFALPTINGTVSGAVTAANLGNIVAQLDVSSAFTGRRLCETTVGLLEDVGLQRWSDNLQLASERTEWITQIRTAETAVMPYFMQEGLHPNYWGQLALRNCVRLAYNGGNIRGGRCSIVAPAGLNNANPREPLMRLD